MKIVEEIVNYESGKLERRYIIGYCGDVQCVEEKTIPDYRTEN